MNSKYYKFGLGQYICAMYVVIQLDTKADTDLVLSKTMPDRVVSFCDFE